MVFVIGEVVIIFVEVYYLLVGSEIVVCFMLKKGNEVEFEKLCNKFKLDDICCLYWLKMNYDDLVFL